VMEEQRKSKLWRSEGCSVFELKGRGGRAGILYFGFCESGTLCFLVHKT
jgi:hypothetical protein